MSVKLNDFILENELALATFLPENNADALMKKKSSRELAMYLLSESNGVRIIDQITAPSEDLESDSLKKQFLEKIIQELTPKDWYHVVTDKSPSTNTLIEQYFKNNLQPDWLLELMLNFSDNALKVRTMTASVANQKLDTSIALTKKIALEKIIALMSSLTDNEKREVILSQSALNMTLMHRAESEGKVDLLLDSIQNSEIKRQLAGFLKTFNVRRRATHFLGLKDSGSTFNYQSNQAEQQIDTGILGFEGMLIKDSMDLFRDSLNQYQPSDSFSAEFDEIKGAFNHIDLNVSLGKEVKDNSAYYQNNNFVVLSSGWPWHSITIAATNDYLVVGNRGQGMVNRNGCIIYPLIQPLTKEDIKIFCEKSSQDIIEQRIRAVVQKDNNNNPIMFHAFPLKPQRYGTCAIANKKAVIAGLLPLLKMQKEAQRPSSFEQSLLEEAEREYKRFTHATRLSALQELFDEFNKESSNKRMILEGIIAYCNQHLDFKSELEEKLIQQIIHGIPESFWEDFANQLTLEAKIAVRYFRENPLEATLPYFIKALSNTNMLINPEVFSSLHEYLERHYPGEFETFLHHVIEKRNHRETPLIFAVHADGQNYLRETIHRYNSSDKQCALDVALDNARCDIAKLLIEQDMEINNQTVEKILTLENKEVINALFAKHPELIQNSICHAGSCSVGLIQFLLDKGATLDAKNELNVTPLMAAIEANNSLLYHFLIAANVDINTQTPKGTALSVACNSVTEEHRDIMSDLLYRKAQSPTIPGRARRIVTDLPLHAAIRLNLTEHISSLISEDNINAYGKDRLTPLMLAVKYNNVAIFSTIMTTLVDLYDEEPETTIHDVNEGLKLAIDNGYSEMAMKLISMLEGPIVIPESELASLISNAIQSKLTEIALVMLDKFPNAFSNKTRYEQALLMAVDNGNIDIVNQLLAKRDASASTWENFDKNLFVRIISNSNKEILQAWINAYPASKNDLLLYSFNKYNHDMVMLSVENGANVNATNEEGMTPVMLAIEGKQWEIASLLIRHGANINATNEEGMTPVMLAAMTGNVKIINELLKKGALIDKISVEGKSALMLAIEGKQWEIASLLIRHGANVDADFMQKHLISVIKQAKFFPEIAMSFITNMNESDINFMDENQSTVLLLAAEAGLSAAVSTLLAKNANIHHSNIFGNTPLMCALKHNHTKVALDLLKNGANAQITNHKNKSPLMYVNNAKLVKALITHGADIEHCDKNGQSAIYYSLVKGHADIVSELAKHSTSRYLYDEFSKPSVRSLFNKLPTNAQNTIQNALKLQLSDDQFSALKLRTPETIATNAVAASSRPVVKPR